MIRSEYVGSAPDHDRLYIEIDSDALDGQVPSAITRNELLSLFYADPTDLATGYAVHVNGSVRNSAGIGFDGVNLDGTTLDTATIPGETVTYEVAVGQGRDPGLPVSVPNPAVGFDLPLALQPNHIGTQLQKGFDAG